MPWTAGVGLFIVVCYLAVATFARWIAPFPEIMVVAEPFRPWGAPYLLGTDNLGRDMLSRLIYGAHNTIGLALIISSTSFLIGVSVGLFSAVVGRWADWLLARVVDVAMSIPQLIFALLVLTLLGTDLPVLVGTIALLDSTKVYRLTRAASQDVMTMDFVQVAVLRRESFVWIMCHELLPNIRSPLLAEFGVRFCYVFLFISGLSFLGVGIRPPAADWGSMVRDNASLIVFGDPTPLLPAIALAILAVCVNFVVDWLLRRGRIS
jgi:peptide/nickel transport system permease protein